MSEYRRNYVPGGTYFFTLVTEGRQAIFTDNEKVALLRQACRNVRQELPFDFHAAVVLPDHLHLIWSLPEGDDAYSKRIGKIKATFTKNLGRSGDSRGTAVSSIRSKRIHRERGVWQRRFWEHTIKDEDEFDAYFNYIHYNPVKHGLASCPHAWEHSSFHRWVEKGVYDVSWGCSCDDRAFDPTKLLHLEDMTGEPKLGGQRQP